MSISTIFVPFSPASKVTSTVFGTKSSFSDAVSGKVCNLETETGHKSEEIQTPKLIDLLKNRIGTKSTKFIFLKVVYIQ